MFELHFFPYKNDDKFIGEDLVVREPFDPNSSSDKMVVAMKLGLVDIVKKWLGRVRLDFIPIYKVQRDLAE
jgi:hypothetical protein